MHLSILGGDITEVGLNDPATSDGNFATVQWGRDNYFTLERDEAVNLAERLTELLKTWPTDDQYDDEGNLIEPLPLPEPTPDQVSNTDLRLHLADAWAKPDDWDLYGLLDDVMVRLRSRSLGDDVSLAAATAIQQLIDVIHQNNVTISISKPRD